MAEILPSSARGQLYPFAVAFSWVCNFAFAHSFNYIPEYIAFAICRPQARKHPFVKSYRLRCENCWLWTGPRNQVLASLYRLRFHTMVRNWDCNFSWHWSLQNFEVQQKCNNTFYNRLKIVQKSVQIRGHSIMLD